MPRPNRKKKSSTQSNSKIVYTKRQEILDSEGWTHVVDAPRKRRSTLTKAANGGLHAGDFEIGGVGYVNRTRAEMEKEVEFWKKNWVEEEKGEGRLFDALRQERDDTSGKLGGDGTGSLKSSSVEHVHGTSKPVNTKREEGIITYDSRKGPKNERWKVDNVVVLGLGSLQSARREGRRATLTQLAALQTIIQYFEQETSPLKVVLQEPQFTPLDIEYLQSLPNHEVVSDPVAFNRITEGSLVYAVHCYSQVYKAVSEGARPAVLIGTDMGNFGRFNMSEDGAETQKSLENLVQDCEVLDFPQVRHDFSDTKIYWRKSITSPTT